MYSFGMVRAATWSGCFNAVADPHWRAMLLWLANAELSVNEIVVALESPQPSVSKHLRILRAAGLVRVRRHDRQRLYCTRAIALRPLHEWSGQFERLWQHQLDRVRDRAEAASEEK